MIHETYFLVDKSPGVDGGEEVKWVTEQNPGLMLIWTVKNVAPVIDEFS
jgi:hypothetical protein